MNKIHPNDLPVLAKIINPNTTHLFILSTGVNHPITASIDCSIQIFTDAIQLQNALSLIDADNCTIINNLINENLSTTISSKCTLIQFKKQKDWVALDYINNPDGTIRWIYPAHQLQPSFLHLYNTSNWKGRLLKQGIRWSFRLGLKKLIKSGRIWIQQAPKPLETLTDSLQQSNYAIFTGTKGENRKAVFVFEEAKTATHFLKVPLTKQATKLVSKEAKQLKAIKVYSFQTLGIPKAQKIGKNLLQTNVCPTVPLPNTALTNIHLKALEELYQQTSSLTYLNQIPEWLYIKSDLKNLSNPIITNDLSLEKIQHLTKQLYLLKEQLPLTLPIPVATSHGDFTPWNSYLTSNKLMVYDWELGSAFPLLYDAIHFIFQSNILLLRQPFSVIQDQLIALQEQPIVQAMLTKYGCRFEDSYHFYLLHTISYYVSRYIHQAHLHEQAHWLVDTWSEALDEVASYSFT